MWKNKITTNKITKNNECIPLKQKLILTNKDLNFYNYNKNEISMASKTVLTDLYTWGNFPEAAAYHAYCLRADNPNMLFFNKIINQSYY